jgi:hypothetical protein
VLIQGAMDLTDVALTPAAFDFACPDGNQREGLWSCNFEWNNPFRASIMWFDKLTNTPIAPMEDTHSYIWIVSDPMTGVTIDREHLH